MKTKKFINELTKDDKSDLYLLLKKKELHPFRNKPGKYLKLFLADKTGDIIGNVWDNAESEFEKLKCYEIVKVRASVREYGNELSLNIDKVKHPEEKPYRDEDFIKSADIDFEEYKAFIVNEIENIKDTDYQKLLKVIFDNKEISEKFYHSQAAKKWHGAYLYGLLEHTVKLVKIAKNATSLYKDCLNEDLVVTGAILHDIGKIYELESKTGEYSVEGRLLSHTYIGADLVKEYSKKLSDFPQSKLNKLTHIILSHHSEREFGALILPQTLEAIIVGNCDRLEADMTGFIEIFRNHTKSAPEGNFSKYIKLKERFLFINK